MGLGRPTVQGRLPRGLLWLVLLAALVLATAPAWRPLFFTTHLTIDDLLDIRCASW